MNYDVFISYSSKDRNIANALLHYLEAKGIKCWIDYRDLLPGYTWRKGIIEALDSNSNMVMVLLFSSSANSSTQIMKELSIADDNKLLVIPVRIENVLPTDDYKYELQGRHWLDAFDGQQNKMEMISEKIKDTIIRHLKSKGVNQIYTSENKTEIVTQSEMSDSKEDLKKEKLTENEIKYISTLEDVYDDGQVSDDERVKLERRAKQLGINEDRAKELEKQVKQQMVIEEQEIEQIPIEENISPDSQLINDRQTDNFNFWKQFLDKIKDKSILYQKNNPSKGSWLTSSSGILRGIYYSVSVSNKFARCDLWIDKSSKEENKLIFDNLLNYKSNIESAMGKTLDWKKLELKKSSSIQFELKGVSVFNKSDWSKMIDFMIEQANLMEKAFNEPLKAIKSGSQISIPDTELEKIEIVNEDSFKESEQQIIVEKQKDNISSGEVFEQNLLESDQKNNEQITGRQSDNFDFWKQFLERIKGKSILFQKNKANKESWLVSSSGILNGVNYVVSISNKFARCELAIQKEALEENKFIFDELLRYKSDIESMIDKSLDWRRLENKKSSAVTSDLLGVSISNKSSWSKINNREK